MTIEWQNTHEIEVTNDDFEEMIEGYTDKVYNYFQESYQKYLKFLTKRVNDWVAGLEDIVYYTITEEAIELITIELHKYIMKNYWA